MFDPTTNEQCYLDYEVTTSQLYYKRCTASYGSITGGYAQPFSTSNYTFTETDADNRIGILSNNPGDSAPQKKHLVQISCPPVSPSSPRDVFTESFTISKAQEFECPKGYYVKRGTSSSFAAPGDTWVKWPNLCESRKTATITVKTQQIASCGTLHPCHPATGDQSRSEVDFVSAGRPFTRYYHSSGQVWGPSGIGINWSLPYDMRLTNVDRTLIDETGSVETLSHVKSEGVNDYGLSLRRKSLGGTTPPIAFCAGSGIAIMICTMHCSRPTEA